MAKLIPFKRNISTEIYRNTSGKRQPSKPTSGRNEGKAALTELRIEKLPTTGATYYANDPACAGLSVRVSAGGVKAFVFTKHKHGRLTRITLGRVGALRLDAARKAAQALHGELALGVDVGAARRAAKTQAKSETMQEAFERFMALKARRINTSMDYERLWRLHMPVGLKCKPVKDVSVNDLQAITRGLAGKATRRQQGHCAR